MACVEAIPVPDSRQKVDELFLFWLSEGSTQEMLRKELSKVCGTLGIDHEEDGEVIFSVPALVTPNSVHRPGSPITRTPSPPMLRSPKSPRSSRRKSPRKTRAKSPRSRRDFLSPDETDFASGVEMVNGGFSLISSPLLHSLGPPSLEANGSELASQATAVNGEDSGSHGGQKQMDLESAAVVPAGGLADLQRRLSESIPPFYFPRGKPRQPDSSRTDEEKLADVGLIFQESANGELPLSQFRDVAKVSTAC